jgi:hypothetical protein
VLACQLLLLIGITSAKGIWMALIGSTFTAGQQFESFTQPSSSDFVPHLYTLRTISENAYAARGALFASRLLEQSTHRLQSGPSLNAMNRRWASIWSATFDGVGVLCSG